MCLAVPMKVRSVDGFNAVCEAKGIEREVSLFMLQGEELAPGDHVLVHVGYETTAYTLLERLGPARWRTRWRSVTTGC